jgi:hypothetical protein
MDIYAPYYISIPIQNIAINWIDKSIEIEKTTARLVKLVVCHALWWAHCDGQIERKEEIPALFCTSSTSACSTRNTTKEPKWQSCLYSIIKRK